MFWFAITGMPFSILLLLHMSILYLHTGQFFNSRTDMSYMLTGNGIDTHDENKVAELYDAITLLHKKLDELGAPPVFMPEVVDSTNALRTNEYLEAKNDILAQLVSFYAAYTDHLTSLTGRVMDVQSGLVQVLRLQSAMIEDEKTIVDDSGRGNNNNTNTSKKRSTKRSAKTVSTRRVSKKHTKR